MQAIIRIGEEDMCVKCGDIGMTAALDEDGLPICADCAAAAPVARPQEG